MHPEFRNVLQHGELQRADLNDHFVQCNGIWRNEFKRTNDYALSRINLLSRHELPDGLHIILRTFLLHRVTVICAERSIS